LILFGSDLNWEDLMGARGLPIRDDLTPEELRGLARRECDRVKATRMLAIANALEGMSRADAARRVGMERQALRDAVVRYNAEGLSGLSNHRLPGRAPRLTPAQREAFRQLVLEGPDIEETGISAWTLPDLCREVERRWGVRYHPGHMSKVVRGLGLSWQKARPAHPQADTAAQTAFAKGGFARRSTMPPRSIPASG